MRAFILSLVVLALAGLAGDRVAHRLATDEAEQRLAARGLADPEVDVADFPFLTQLLSRRFGEVDVRSSSLQWAGRTAREVTATGSEVAVPRDGRVTVGRLTARGTVGYDEVLREAGRPGLRLRGGGDGTVRLRRQVTVLGRTVTVAAVARVLARDDRLRIVPTRVELAGGGDLDRRTADLLQQQLAVDYPIPGLPRGMTVRSITAGRDGFVVGVAGEDVSFAR